MQVTLFFLPFLLIPDLMTADGQTTVAMADGTSLQVVDTLTLADLLKSIFYLFI